LLGEAQLAPRGQFVNAFCFEQFQRLVFALVRDVSVSCCLLIVIASVSGSSLSPCEERRMSFGDLARPEGRSLCHPHSRKQSEHYSTVHLL
jgi:hypothetical protein